jgi:beta-glucanase (GH16 family)
MILRLCILVFATALWAGPEGAMKLAFEDQFNDKSIDESKWSFKKEIVKLVDGKASIEVISGGKSTIWRSGELACKFKQSYGYFEASIQMVQTKGHGVGFGISGSSLETKFPSASLGFECGGADKVDPYLNVGELIGNQRLRPKENPIKMEGGVTYKKFNTYGLLVTPKTYLWYVNGRQVFRVERLTPSGPLQLKFSHGTPEGGVLRGFPNPALGPEPLVIDWVKIWK